MKRYLFLKCKPVTFVLTILIGLLAACTSLPAKIEEKTGEEMALIPAGEFQMTILDEMKDERSLRTVHLDDFYIDVYEVTNRDYAACVEEGGCVEPVNTMEYSDNAFLDHPVVFVTWDMANSFCEWRGARLPTRAEWEKAAADELETIEYYFGDISPLCQVGSRLGAGIDEKTNYNPDTKPVGLSTPNTYGLYEMTEGMWEWVLDRNELDVYETSPDYVSFLRMYRWSGYGPLYNRYLCSFRCARSP
ncbi:MAG: formylglycine-generating enzyme family protein [Anaerolineales bacterium]|jgi:formylglycine-generating enzyme required for sulfatase activity